MKVTIAFTEAFLRFQRNLAEFNFAMSGLNQSTDWAKIVSIFGGFLWSRDQ